MQAWNFITQPNAKLVSENMYKGTVKSYLIDNRAWNVICNKFNSILGNTDAEKTIANSTKWGNYYDTNTTNYNSINGLWALHTYGDPWTIPTQYKKEAIPTEVPDGRKNNNRIELGTGVCDNFKVYNIYDMAGNMNEWTTSHNAKGGNVYGVFRGGSFDCHGTNDPVVRAGGKFDIERCAADVSFRVVLYI